MKLYSRYTIRGHCNMPCLDESRQCPPPQSHAELRRCVAAPLLLTEASRWLPHSARHLFHTFIAGKAPGISPAPSSAKLLRLSPHLGLRGCCLFCPVATALAQALQVRGDAFQSLGRHSAHGHRHHMPQGIPCSPPQGRHRAVAWPDLHGRAPVEALRARLVGMSRS